MPAEAPGYSFTMRDGTVLTAHELARGIYLLMQDEPKRIFDRIWKFIETEIPTDRRAQFESDFLERMRLYSEAAVLRVLITTKNNDKRYEPLLWEFEEYLFPSRPTEEGQKKLEALKSAMGDIQALSANPQPSWARDWFLQLGYDETNPATLLAFIQMFAVGTQAFRKILKETIPH
jgi:hypothetical protein